MITQDRINSLLLLWAAGLVLIGLHLRRLTRARGQN